MAKKCDRCGKTAHFGNRVSHSKQHTRRRWMPNVQPVTVAVEGRTERLYLCTRCLRTQHKLAQ
ncbi:MAG: 50S ribosomal protein L28 [Chloroflexi bacterium]|nr:50S ribosomal protein L28 [Chloroflexota bacterium]MBM4451521.1 50S ribosomal protein L28 [Chloroflexota bacterium]